VILFELVSSQPPFSGHTKMDLLASHLTAAPPRLGDLRPSLPAGLEDIVRRGLAKTREARYASAAEMRADLDAVLAGRWVAEPETLAGSPSTDEAERARTPAPLAPANTSAAPAPSRRRRTARAAAATVALVLAGGVGLSSFARRAERAGSPRPHEGLAAAPAAPRAPQASALVAPAIARAPEAPPTLVALAGPPPEVPALQDGPRAAPPAAHPPRGRSVPARHRAAAEAPAAPAAAAEPGTKPAPPTSAALLAEGERLIAEGRAHEGCRLGEEVVRAEPDSAPALRFLGRCYMRIGQRQAALASYRRYLELAPGAPDAALVRSILE
jgi:serine/threonine-protein kinase